jgi:hypothetical protein
MGTAAAACLGVPGDSNGTIAAAWQRTQTRQRVCHSDTNGTDAYTDARSAPPPEPLLSRYLRQNRR